METKRKIIALLIILFAGLSMATQKSSAQGVTVGFQVFYDELSPYGTWIDSPDYGYVWIPDVAPGFTPYSTNGYWVFTDQGWTWVSDYSWGWAPFHYGRWYMDERYGAIWVPDDEWGPGWVTWRRSEGFYGWAPIGPGVSLSIAYGNGYQIPNNQWTFVKNGDFGRTNISKYYINSTYNVTIIHNSTIINNSRIDRSRNVIYNAGPERPEVERRSGKKITPIMVTESSRPAQKVTNTRLQIYKPNVGKANSTQRKPAPAKVGRLENIKTSGQRKGEAPGQKANQQNRQQPQQRAPQQERQQSPQQQRAPQQEKLKPQQQQRAPQQEKQKPQQQQRSPKQEKKVPQQPKPPRVSGE
jgi:hypothetical protein